MVKYITLITIITLNFCGYSQTLKEVQKLENKYQECLDSGNAMKKCSEDFYNTSDSLLNVSYRNLKIKISSTEQNFLKIEQRKWLKKRDVYFDKAYEETIKIYGNQTESNDFKMIVIDKQSDFVIIRVKELINRRNKIKV